ncbi:MAG: energy transducer TonB [Candidatus Omnitrophica bacterium]|nr:energy transducer TonB [Candidatus Omnitrophota bacterium]
MPEDKIIAIAFFIALGVHGFILAFPEELLNFFDKKLVENELLVEIEIEKPRLLPKIDMIGEEKKLKKTDIAKEIKPQPEVEDEIKDEIIKEEKQIGEEKIKTTDPQNEEMFRYKDAIKQRIESYRRYPRSARRHKIEGIAILTFMVSEKGTVSSINVVRSSGYNILDIEAAATVKRASPFPAIPSGIELSYIEMEAAIVFNLE